MTIFVIDQMWDWESLKKKRIMTTDPLEAITTQIL